MRNFLAMVLVTCGSTARAKVYNIEGGADFEEKCLKKVKPGDTCRLARGNFEHDGITRTHGREDARITIEGESGACIKGSNTQDRVLQIAHDYYTIKNLCFDGQHGSDHVSTAIYALGADRKSDLTKNGVTIKSSVTGLQLFDLEIKNFAEECIHFRYSVTFAEVQGCTVQHCGISAFEEGRGGKVGECIYIGTASDQVDDGKAPEPKLRTGSADNVGSDNCAYNWIHHNTLRSYGNECVDVKEGSSHNLIENNICEQQQDPNSGGFGLRGSDNTVRWNEIAECKGAGVRMGGRDGFGRNNHIYGNVIKNADAGAFSVQSPDQGVVCENKISGVDRVVRMAFGTYSSQSQFSKTAVASDCTSYPGGEGIGSDSSPSSHTPQDSDDDEEEGDCEECQDDNDDDEFQVGVNFTEDAEGSVPHVYEIETNTAAGSSGQGECEMVLEVSKVLVEHADYADPTTDVNNLFDADLDTYYSVKRESTSITFELEETTVVNGVAIGFFMKSKSEERIQTFDVAVKKEGDGDWRTVIFRKGSSGDMGGMQTFPFSSRSASYVRFQSRGNSFNNWTPLRELEICGRSQGQSNALFGGVQAVNKELEFLAGEVCPSTHMISPVKAKASGSDNVKVLFDGNFHTRWTAFNTQNEFDLENDMVQLTFEGDMRISKVHIAFFDGNLAHQYFSLYTQSASDSTWAPVLQKERAALSVTLQTYDINMDGVHKLYIVGNGNEVGSYTKISEVEVMGC